MKRLCALIALILFAFPAIPHAQELTDEKIVKDYKAFMALPDNEECMKLIVPREIRVLERKADEKHNTVKILVTCDWVGDGNRTFYSGPCAGFRKAKGKGQTMWHHLYYEWKGTKWVLVGVR